MNDTRRLYARSYLCYGHNEARGRFLAHQINKTKQASADIQYYSASYLVWPLLGFFTKFALFCSQKTTVRVKLKFGMQVRMPFLILCTKFET